MQINFTDQKKNFICEIYFVCLVIFICVLSNLFVFIYLFSVPLNILKFFKTYFCCEKFMCGLWNFFFINKYFCFKVFFYFVFYKIYFVQFKIFIFIGLQGHRRSAPENHKN